jgi:uncharacterized membrane protein
LIGRKSSSGVAASLLVGCLFVETLAAMLFFAMAHSRTLAYRTPSSATRVVTLPSGHSGWPGGSIAIIVPYLLMAVSALFVRFHPSEIPAWQSAGGIGAFGPLLIGALIVVSLHLTGCAIALGAARRGTSGEDAASHLRFHRAVLRLFSGLAILISVIVSQLTVLILLPWESRSIQLTVLVSLIVMALLVWPLLRSSSSRAYAGDGTFDDRWKWGLFYHNPEDPALFVEQRFGVGYTVNLAHWKAWVFLTGIAMLIAATGYITVASI